ncbi:glycosyltransferase [Vibrio parahaemolyticus]|uniref:glycosyltransferase n=1 Tax=Vibrio parahaemolyticus TaxID=670 RepID=UPI000A3A6470|nr:glycosyltransferase [Vibrio parahaemolyticus]EHH2567858.1 glycosyltransferase family 4 protein [Vibrio parahaemolyticus]OUJ36393.1 hypothetical protein BTR40_10830 [Vibrio parahaemolyticus]
MTVYITLLDYKTLGGIERVAKNLHQALMSTKINDISIIDLDTLRALFGEEKSEFTLLLKFSKTLGENDIVISMYDRLSIEFSVCKALGHKFKLVAAQHADYFANRIHTRILRRLTYSYVDSIVALTKFDSDLYKKWHKNVVVIPNPILSFPETVPSFMDRKELVISAGRLNKIKQFDHFIRLADSMRDFCELEFHLYGSGEEKANLTELIESFGMSPKIILKGATNELEKIMLSSKFIVVTSLRESFSMVVLEAMAAGCIPISYNCPTGPRELISDGVNGYLVEPDNLEEIKRLISLLLENDDIYNKIQSHARVTAKRYQARNINKMWEKLLNEK